MNEATYHAILKRLGVDLPAPPLHHALVARLVSMPLDRFADEGCLLEVRVPWLEVSLWFVPGEADIEALAREGISRGRVWTALELANFLTIPSPGPDQVKTIARAKREFGGEVEEVRPRVDGPARRRAEEATP